MRIFIILISYLFWLFLSNPLFAQEGGSMPTAEEIIKKLDLKPLPEEGGYYRETYRSEGDGLPAKSYGINADSNRSVSTAIYYLVTPDNFSSIHRVKSDEVFHFYAGDPVEMIQFDESGKLEKFIMGNDIMNGESPQIVVPKHIWQALRLKEGGQWALFGTTVAPGFEFEDFEVGKREEMLKQYPHLEADILRFTVEEQ